MRQPDLDDTTLRYSRLGDQEVVAKHGDRRTHDGAHHCVCRKVHAEADSRKRDHSGPEVSGQHNWAENQIARCDKNKGPRGVPGWEAEFVRRDDNASKVGNCSWGSSPFEAFLH